MNTYILIIAGDGFNDSATFTTGEDLHNYTGYFSPQEIEEVTDSGDDFYENLFGLTEMLFDGSEDFISLEKVSAPRDLSSVTLISNEL